MCFLYYCHFSELLNLLVSEHKREGQKHGKFKKIIEELQPRFQDLSSSCLMHGNEVARLIVFRPIEFSNSLLDFPNLTFDVCCQLGGKKLLPLYLLLVWRLFGEALF